MNLAELKSQLHAEGFDRAYVWQDASGVFYSEHTHPTLTAHSY
jgi:hypothetical protein